MINQDLRGIGFTLNASSDIDIIYNFGISATGAATPTILGGDRTIYSGAEIRVNDDARIRDIAATTNPQNESGGFLLKLSDGKCEPIADLEFQADSKFTIGHNPNYPTDVRDNTGTRVVMLGGSYFNINSYDKFRVKSKGVLDGNGVPIDNEWNGGLVVHEGALADMRYGGELLIDGGTVRIKAGGILKTSYYGRVTVRNGGRLILEPGAIIQLWGGDSPEGDGTVHIRNGGTLEIQGEYDLTGNGFLQFDLGAFIEGPGDLVIRGDGTDFRRLQLNASAQLELAANQDFDISRARVVYNVGSGLSTKDGGEILAKNSKFIGLGYGQLKSDGTGSVYIRDCDFTGFRTAIDVETKSLLEETSIISSTFVDGARPADGSNIETLDKFAAVRITGDGYDVPVVNTPTVTSSEFKNVPRGVVFNALSTGTVQRSSFFGVEKGDRAFSAELFGQATMLNCTVQDYEHEPVAPWLYQYRDGAVYISGFHEDLNDDLVNEIYSTLTISGGDYTNNYAAVAIDEPSDLILRGCVNITSNMVGVSASAPKSDYYPRYDLTLAGSTLRRNQVGIHGFDINILSTRPNTFGNSDGPTMRLYDPAAGNGSIVLNNNFWEGPDVDMNGLPSPQTDWLEVRNNANPTTHTSWLANPAIVTTVSAGCGFFCNDPATCDTFCDIYSTNEDGTSTGEFCDTNGVPLCASPDNCATYCTQYPTSIFCPGSPCNSPECPTYCEFFPEEKGCSGTIPQTERGLSTTPNNTIVLYPNPTDDSFVVSGLPATATHIKIADLTGRILEQIRLEGVDSPALNINDFPSGIYAVSIHDKHGLIETLRVVRL